MNMATKTTKPHQNKNQVTTGVVLTVLAGALIALAILFPQLNKMNSGNSTTYKMPVIVTKMTSDDGGEHTVQTQFSVKVDSKANNKVSSTTLSNALKEIMAEMDYDTLASTEGVDYINQQATEALQGYLPEYEGSKVYLTDLYVGDNHVLSSPHTEQQQSILKSLFKNTK